MHVHPVGHINKSSLIAGIMQWANQYSPVCCLNSNSYTSDKINFIIAIGKQREFVFNANSRGDAFALLQEFYNNANATVYGHFGYDLKNNVESLISKNSDHIGFPDMYFFVPEITVQLDNNELHITGCIDIESIKIYNEIIHFSESIKINKPHVDTNVSARYTEQEYIDIVTKLKHHIQIGDIFEVNFCQEFFIDGVVISPVQLYLWLNEIAPSPFSCFYKIEDKYLISSSPERYLQKQQDKLISQPIKGTARRGNTNEEDELIKQELALNGKEKNENVMIVDLVRNDLSRVSLSGTVKVEELFGIYTFKQVHQMISTVSGILNPDLHLVDAIRYTFPMGSMTGAPKIKAMQLIDQYESFKRGLFSGSVGYITKDGDFDFNVIIRSFLYNQSTKYLLYPAGSAITDKAVAQQEYIECLLKAKPIFMLCE